MSYIIEQRIKDKNYNLYNYITKETQEIKNSKDENVQKRLKEIQDFLINYKESED